MSVRRADFKAEEVITELRRANQSLLRQLTKAKVRNEELVAAAYRAAKEAAESLIMPPIPKAPRMATKPGSREIAVAMFADWQLGKTTPSYDSEACEQRVETCIDKIVNLTNIQRAEHPVREARVYALGDMVEGEMIFPGQAHLIDASMFQQVMVDGPRIFGNALRRIASHFDITHVECCTGNHGAVGGKSRREYHPESNCDSMLYEFTRRLTAEDKRLTWGPTYTKGERHWYRLDRLGPAATFFLFHGNQIKGGFAGFPWYAFHKQVLRWRSIVGPFNYSASGHFHTALTFPIGDIEHYACGSTESDNTYAAEWLASQSRPTQWLLFVEPQRIGVTAEYKLRHL